MSLIGYASVFNVLSHTLGENGRNFKELVAPGAFDDSLDELNVDDPDYDGVRDCKFTFNHNPDMLLGRTKNKSLSLVADDKGLRFRCRLNPAMQSHRDLYAACKDGLLSECSFAFLVPPDGDTFDDATDDEGNRCVRRTLRKVDVWDASLVSSAAYPGTSCDARAKKRPYSHEQMLDIERKLRAAMYSEL